jgi:hypothetical protein
MSKFVHALAERTLIPDEGSLHICVHNPMVDPYLTDMYQNFQKGVWRETLLLIIFPPLARFNACFESPMFARTRTARYSQFVTTMADFETLLLQMTAGFMPKIVFVFPRDISQTAECQASLPAWLCCQRVLGSSNCHWVEGVRTVRTAPRSH